MLKKLCIVVALAAMSFMMMPIDDADARRGSGGGFRSGGGGAFRAARVARPPAFRAPAFRAGPRFVVRPYNRRPIFRRGIVRPIYVAPVVIGVGRCEWLRRRAVITGSPYWWRRYYRCRRGW